MWVGKANGFGRKIHQIEHTIRNISKLAQEKENFRTQIQSPRKNPCINSKIIALYFLVFREIFNTILREVKTGEKGRYENVHVHEAIHIVSR